MVLRWGICGAGRISNDFCIALKTSLTENHEIVAVGARDGDRAQKFAEKFGIRKVYGSYEEMSRDQDVDVVYVGVIHPEHQFVSELMMNAGKNVLCEKPMTLNLIRAKQVHEVAKRNNVFFMEAWWSRFFPTYERIKEELTEGTLGEIKLVTANFCQPAMNLDRIAKKNLGGGGLVDFGCYLVHFASFIFNEYPEKIIAEGSLTPEGVDEAGCIMLRYKNGGMANLSYNGRCLKADNVATVYGTKGNIKVFSPFWCPSKIVTPSGEFSFKLPEPCHPTVYNDTVGLSFEAECVRQCLEKGHKECPMMPHSYSEMVISILDEIRKQLGVIYDVDEVQNS